MLLSDSPAHSFFFVILTAAAAANLLTDSAFIALRGAKYNLLVDGIVQSLIKLALVAPLVALGRSASTWRTGCRRWWRWC